MTFIIPFPAVVSISGFPNVCDVQLMSVTDVDPESGLYQLHVRSNLKQMELLMDAQSVDISFMATQAETTDALVKFDNLPHIRKIDCKDVEINAVVSSHALHDMTLAIAVRLQPYQADHQLMNRVIQFRKCIAEKAQEHDWTVLVPSSIMSASQMQL